MASPFSITTIMISVPFAIIAFAMIATLWRGAINLASPMLFALGGLATFLVGGVTGIFLGSAASDIYMHGTYFVVAHFHYTLFPVVFFGGFAGLYFWFPKMFGKMMNEALAKIHFWISFVAFNGIFIPLFFVGLGGSPRRIYELSSYEMLKHLQPLHVVATVAAIALLLGQIPFLVNFVYSLARGPAAEKNPWHANTLEWTVDSPPKHPNFAVPPRVFRDPYEYSDPGAAQDWIGQDALDQGGAQAAGL
jgi:cytochrome c oxidase subunit 1